MKVLMCPPEYYQIGWTDPEKNPWMKEDEQPYLPLAKVQWVRLVSFLERLGVGVYKLDPRQGLGDQVFTANVAALFRNRSGYKVFVKANLAPKERRPESRIAAEHLFRNGFRVFNLPEHFIFEGQGDVITTPYAYLYCYGIRNQRDAMEEIELNLRLPKPVLYLKLVDPRFYHGDMCMRYSRFRDALLFYPGAFDAESVRLIENMLVRKKKEIRENQIVQNVEYQDGKVGRNFPVNGCYIGKVETFPWNDFFGEFPSEIRSWVEEDGGEVVTMDYSQFGLSGAGHRCTVLFLD